MLKASHFELPLERQLTLVKIAKEVDECRDIDTLRESVKSLSRQNAQFQHMINELLRESLTSEVNKLFKLEAKGKGETNG